jgi:phosphatidylglycerophosphatase A
MAEMIAGVFGIGRFPWAPGTLASFVAVVAGAGLLHFSPWLLAAAAIVATVAGLWAIAATGAGAADPGWVVIDEVAGQWLTMLALPRPTLPGLLAAFLLFRLLDIAKPGPIGWADRRHDAIGVMADDVIAGLIGAGILLVVRAILPGALD